MTFPPLADDTIPFCGDLIHCSRSHWPQALAQK